MSYFPSIALLTELDETLVNHGLWLADFDILPQQPGRIWKTQTGMPYRIYGRIDSSDAEIKDALLIVCT